MNKKLEKESVLDQPLPGMCQEVWDLSDKENPILKEQVEQKIRNIVNWVVERFDLINQSVNITGSITSNSYSKDSDIDVHIYSPLLTKENVDQMNKDLRQEYDQSFRDSFSGTDKIGSHPIEVYFQINPIQDLMSVGCYDFLNRKWLVGPEMMPLSFDPYEKYYDEDMEYVDKIIKDIRNLIFHIYEMCNVLKNSKNVKFKSDIASEFIHEMQVASDLFDNMRKMRTSYSSPTSKEQALKLRNSKKWKIADSSFKLMDKFGYLPIMKFFKTSNQEIKENPEKITEIVQDILDRFNLKGEEQVDISSLKESETESEIDWEDLKRHFAVTSDFENAFFILPDGSLLDTYKNPQDGEEEQEYNGEHASVNNYFKEDGIYGGINKMLDNGAIRIRLDGNPIIDLRRKPTIEEMDTLYDFVEAIENYGGEIIDRISVETGKNKWKDFSGDETNKIIPFIRKSFNN